jgi:hypothetical protein
MRDKLSIKGLLLSHRTRAGARLARQLLGGHMEIVALKGPGTAFRIVFPLPKDNELGEKL